MTEETDWDEVWHLEQQVFVKGVPLEPTESIRALLRRTARQVAIHRGCPLKRVTLIGPCDGSAATLGLGDVRGLKQKYRASAARAAGGAARSLQRWVRALRLSGCRASR